MISFIRVKNLAVLTKGILRNEILNFSSYTGRSLFIKSAAFSNCIFKREFTVPEIKNYIHSQSNPKDFGKVVDLDLDFDDVRIDDEIKPKKRTKNKKIAEGLPTRGDKETKEHETSELEDLDLCDHSTVDNSVNVERKKMKEFAKRSTQRESKKTKTKDDTELEEEKRYERRGYEDLGRNSVLFGSVMTKVKSKKSNKNSRLIALEGKRLIHDALAAGLTPSKIFFSRASDLEEICVPESVEIFRVPYKKLVLWSQVITPQGVVGIFEVQEKIISKSNTNCLPVTIICDNIKDPGNLGAILRVIAAVGCEKLILMQGCVDVWEPKVIRAGAGAHFRLPVLKVLSWKDIENEIEEESKILLADINFNENSDINDETNEGRSWSFSKSSEISEFLPKHCYHSIEYEFRNIVIVIGGETHGLSDEAYQFAINRSGAIVYIPMNNKIESLNTSVALGILTYEIRRQLSEIIVENSQSTKDDAKSESKLIGKLT